MSLKHGDRTAVVQMADKGHLPGLACTRLARELKVEVDAANTRKPDTPFMCTGSGDYRKKCE